LPGRDCPPGFIFKEKIDFFPEWGYYLIMKSKLVLLILMITGFLAIFACTNPIIERFLNSGEETFTPGISLSPTYTVTFESNGGSPVDSQTVAEGDTATRPENPTKDAYGFVYWYDNAELSEPRYDFDTPVTDDITLYAKWSRTFYAVSFESNGGTAVNSQTVAEGGTATRPENPTRNAYAFVNWYDNADMSEPYYDFDTPVTGGITLYAKWIPAYTVTFMDGDNELTGLRQTGIPHGNTVNKPVIDPTKNGYAFNNWYSNIGLTTLFDFSTQITANTTVYAKWSPAYTITYMDVGGGTFSGEHGSDYPTTHIYGTATTLTDPTKTGYIFGGWFINSDGLRPALNSLSATGYTVGITLYARWNIVSPMGHNLVYIPSGTFTMGSPANEPYRQPYATDETQHRVTLTQGFYMGEYTVTQAQYKMVMGSNPSFFSSNGGGKARVDGLNTADFPVEWVSWYEALVFCNKLSVNEDLEPAYRINGSTDPAAWGVVPESDNPTWNAVQIVAGSNGYRLPTEAQWEYACRAGTLTAYNWGTGTIDPTQANYTMDRTIEVGNYAPNAWGLHDMHGNVYEWCWDWYGYYESEVQTDPMGAAYGDFRVRRGGSMGIEGQHLRSALREGQDPYYRGTTTGFRLVRP
jgi:uncharacterized repeat protein (TIGR02543 family)